MIVSILVLSGLIVVGYLYIDNRRNVRQIKFFFSYVVDIIAENDNIILDFFELILIFLTCLLVALSKKFAKITIKKFGK